MFRVHLHHCGSSESSSTVSAGCWTWRVSDGVAGRIAHRRYVSLRAVTAWLRSSPRTVCSTVKRPVVFPWLSQTNSLQAGHRLAANCACVIRGGSLSSGKNSIFPFFLFIFVLNECLGIYTQWVATLHPGRTPCMEPFCFVLILFRFIPPCLLCLFYVISLNICLFCFRFVSV